ncbi:MAG TPA: hypothetical protein VM869_19365 [Enhygromyxa sp.]|nr:hypothetical protein [Enhygromyxa sp.]
MADIAALLSSTNEHYCTPPEVVSRVRAVLVPDGSGRTLFDPSSNDSSIVGANMIADGIRVDGLTCAWDCCDTWYGNFPYGLKLPDFARRAAHWGRGRGVPGITLTPARSDTEWTHVIKSTADAWCEVRGRLTFWTPCPIRKRDAIVRASKNKPPELIFLQRWWPWATEENLPKPFRLLRPGWAVGPELSKDGKPQPAPFPSLIGFWADPMAMAAEPDPRHELEALRELVRVAACDVIEARRHAHEESDSSKVRATASWLGHAETMLRDKYNDCDPLREAVFEPIASTRKRKPKHPIDVRTFAQHFLPLGTVTVARGLHRGVYHPRAAQ